MDSFQVRIKDRIKKKKDYGKLVRRDSRPSRRGLLSASAIDGRLADESISNALFLGISC